MEETSASPGRGQAAVRELVDFALVQLPAMRAPGGEPIFCYEVLATDMMPRGRSVRYSAMAALGLLRARRAGYELAIDVERVIDTVLAAHGEQSVTPGDLGLLLWLAARAGRAAAASADLAAALERSLAAEGGLAALQGMEVAWIAIGAHEAALTGDGGAAARLLDAARRQLCVARRTASGLLAHHAGGLRARFPNFATEIYGVLALTRLGRAGDEGAMAAALRVADAIIALQRPDGGWPWLFDARRGTVVEPYEVYAVHQDAMAPMGLLELYEATGEGRYRKAAVHGLRWLDGANDLGRPLRIEPTLIARSIRRRAPWDRLLLYLNTATAFLGRPAFAGWPGRLEFNASDRPYHLGWILEAWCGREQLA